MDEKILPILETDALNKKNDTISLTTHPKCRGLLWTNYLSGFVHVGSKWLGCRLHRIAWMCLMHWGEIQNHQSTGIFAPNKAFDDLWTYETTIKITMAHIHTPNTHSYAKKQTKFIYENIHIHNKEIPAFHCLRACQWLNPLTTRVTLYYGSKYPIVADVG